MSPRLALALLLFAAPLTGFAASDTVIPAGSLIKCTIDEPKLSSKTIAVGDPVLCQVSHSELYGRFSIPFGSYLVGTFADYKDPGHFVGKGWVELKFDRLVIKPDTILPVNARVIATPKYPVDDQGRIHGKGHTTRDIIEWSIPVLWPIDLIELPRRGPRVVLKAETQLTLRVMDDLGIPFEQQTPYQQQPTLAARTPEYQQPQYPQPQYAQPAPVYQNYAPQPQYQGYQPPPQTIIYNNYAPPQPPQQQQQTVVVQQQQPAPPQVRYVPRPVPAYPYSYGPYAYPPPPPRYYGGPY